MVTGPPEIVEIFQKGVEEKERGNKVASALLFKRVIEMSGEWPKIKGGALNNLGLIMSDWGHHAEATTAFRYAVGLAPDVPEHLNNYALTRRFVGDYKGASSVIRKALEFEPNHPEAQFNNAVIQLLSGDLKQGFRTYKYRWKFKSFSTQPLPTDKPEWEGQPLGNKTLLVTREQGFGDEIQFIRYLYLVKAQNPDCRIKYFGSPELQSLFGHVHGIDEHITEIVTGVGGKIESNLEFDYHCPLLNLPAVFNTKLSNVPAHCPYINLPEQPYLETGRINIGICWAGRPSHGNDKKRSIPFEEFAHLMPPGALFFSLQAGPRAQECVGEFIHKPPLTSFLETAKLICRLDLVVTVDTAVAHLAGALGTPVWILLPFDPDWRWMLTREDSPWYPSAQLFRQPALDDWGSVIQRVKNELRNLIERDRSDDSARADHADPRPVGADGV